MDPAAVASGLIAARMGQVQMAVAARMMKQAHAMDAAVIQQLVAAANQNAARLASSVQPGMGGIVDVTV